MSHSRDRSRLSRLRPIVGPEGVLFESDKSNNETDVLLTINANNTFTELQQRNPVLPQPPAIVLSAPADRGRYRVRSA